MKKARLRITLVSGGRRETVVFEFPDICMAERGLTSSLPLLKANGGKVPEKRTHEQMAFIPLLK